MPLVMVAFDEFAPDVVADLHGLQIVRAEPVTRPVQTDDGEKLAIDLLVRARRPLGRP